MKPFDEMASKRLEKGFSTFQRGGDSKMQLQIGSLNYDIDFAAMVQINPVSSYKRQIKRQVWKSLALYSHPLLEYSQPE